MQRPKASTKLAKCDDQQLKKSNIADCFELLGAPDSKPSCPMEQCKGQTYHDRSGLLRHLRQQHKVSKQFLDEIKQKIPPPKEKIQCLICSWVGLKTNRANHFEKHIHQEEEKKIKAAKEALAQKEHLANQITRLKSLLVTTNHF